MLATLVGLSLLLVLVGGTVTLICCLLAPRLRARQARLHPQQTAIRQRTRQARRLAAEWPLLAQTLGLGYRDQWTRQHRFPTAEFVADDQGVTATVAAIAGAGLADYQGAAGYLADTWGCVSVRAEQQGPGLIRLRGPHRDPLLAPARIDLPGLTPASLESWWLGWAEDGSLVMVRLAEVSGIVVAGLAGFGKTMLVAHVLGQLAPSAAVQFVLVDGKGGPDYDRLFPRAWLSAKDDLDQVRNVLRRVHRLMVDRQASIAQVLGVTDAWHLDPSPSWPLIVVVIDEAHTFFHERKGTSPEVKAHNAVVAELSRLVEELIRKGRNVAIQVMLLTQRATGDAIPTRIRDNCQVAISFATRTVDGAVAALGEEIRQHPDASPVLLNDPAYVGVAVTSLPGRPGFHRVRPPRWTSTRSRPSSGSPPGCGVIRLSCWPSRRRGCGSCHRCQLLGMQHDRCPLGPGRPPPRLARPPGPATAIRPPHRGHWSAPTAPPVSLAADAGDHPGARRLAAGRIPANPGQLLSIRQIGAGGWFRPSPQSRRWDRSRVAAAAPADARPRSAACGFPG
jgi:DNA segregation ATPase FtsK/SpoIIIE, S-DNA-T family